MVPATAERRRSGYGSFDVPAVLGAPAVVTWLSPPGGG
jgi:hypothetical protein